MRVEGTIHILREYNKWRRGKGRKYQAPSMPFDGETIGLTIDDLNESNKVSANQLKVDLDALERELVMENYQKVLKGLSAIDEQQLDSILLKMQFYFIHMPLVYFI